MNNDVRNLASFVTFKQLYDEGKNDIYYVISRFVESIIVVKTIYSFNLNEMNKLLEIEYGFDIPNYVLQTAIRRLDYVTKDSGKYIVDPQKLPKSANELSNKYSLAITKNNSLLQSITSYVESKVGSLTEEEVGTLESEVSMFLLDDSSTGDYTEYITAYIIEQENTAVEHQLQEIKEGIVILTGLSYNEDISNQGAWKNDLVLFVETEILFHLAGYNGEIFQVFAKELFDLINEMNSKSGKKTIKVCYWSEVKEEIDNFFEAARLTVRDHRVPDISNTAMVEITNGCQVESDVFTKKANFYRLLNNYSISEFMSYDYYSQNNHDYNLESNEALTRFSLDESQEKYLRHVSYINILRKGTAYKDINKSKYLLLTETGKILHIANDLTVDKSYVPFAVNMNVLTNRLWYDLNKGFGKGVPSGFDVILKAKVVLANVLSKSVSAKYEHVKQAFRTEEISRDTLLDTVLTLKSEMVQPENISSSNVDDVLTTISTKELVKHQGDKEVLRSELAKKDRIIEKQEKSLEKTTEELGNKNTALIKAKKDLYDNLMSTKNKIDKRAKNIIRIFDYLVILLVLGYLIAVVLSFILLDTDYKNIITGLITIIPPALVVVLSLIINKPFQLIEVKNDIENRFDSWYKRRYYSKYNIDLDTLHDLEIEIKSIEKTLTTTYQ